MNKKFLGNLLFMFFLMILISGLLMFLIPFNKKVASLHTFFGFLVLISVLFHIINNRKSLQYYLLKGNGTNIINKYPFLIIALISFIITIGIYLDLPVFNSVYNFGNTLRNKQLGKEEQNNDYQIIKLNNTIGNYSVDIEIKKGKYFGYPLFAVWIEDSTGNYLKTIYVSKSISSSIFRKVKKVGNKWKPDVVRRPEALPYWSHKRNIKALDGLYVPLSSSPDLDAVTGATPTSNFIISSNIDMNNFNGFRILLEVNQSFDWNNYYSKDKFPTDSIYSGSGNVGQPALVYLVYVSKETLQTKNVFLMELIGHSHHSGASGELFSDLSNITTAKEIIDRAIVTIRNNN